MSDVTADMKRQLNAYVEWCEVYNRLLVEDPEYFTKLDAAIASENITRIDALVALLLHPSRLRPWGLRTGL